VRAARPFSGAHLIIQSNNSLSGTRKKGLTAREGNCDASGTSWLLRTKRTDLPGGPTGLQRHLQLSGPGRQGLRATAAAMRRLGRKTRLIRHYQAEPIRDVLGVRKADRVRPRHARAVASPSWRLGWPAARQIALSSPRTAKSPYSHPEQRKKISRRSPAQHDA
jgi:hypothetical protein